MRLIASNKTAFFELECCTFFDLGGSYNKEHYFTKTQYKQSNKENVIYHRRKLGKAMYKFQKKI